MVSEYGSLGFHRGSRALKDRLYDELQPFER